ncbi:MAG TPA: 30S ribosomal protein S1, partial [Alphaproteobacteria bacterium]|nr:30S ribosomal protein S1 [Alphaproteobacteria bacterium]
MQSTPNKESFADLLEESFSQNNSFEGKVVTGKVVGIVKDAAVIDVGLKSEGRVSLKEFPSAREIKVGDDVEVYIERLEDRNGEAVLSISKARREAAWVDLEKSHEQGQLVNGIIFGKIRGGYTVQIEGDIVAFLPGSQVDIRPIRDAAPLMNISQPLKILKMDKARNNIVVSRRAVLEESRAEARNELLANLVEGQELTGMVKNITDYGAFIDLGGFDGLLHVTDISWKRIAHPSEALKVGDNIRVKVIRFNAETQRISLGMKQLEADPWQDIEKKYPINSRHVGTITNITDYGAFIELEPAVEGLIYVTEMSWTKKNVHPSKLLTKDQKVDVMVLDIDMSKRRISLGMKQCLDNPWKTFMDKHPIGSIVSGEIKNITEFGLFVGVSDDLDGMVHMSDVSWQDTEDTAKSLEKGQ